MSGSCLSCPYPGEINFYLRLASMRGSDTLCVSVRSFYEEQPHMSPMLAAEQPSFAQKKRVGKGAGHGLYLSIPMPDVHAPVLSPQTMDPLCVGGGRSA